VNISENRCNQTATVPNAEPRCILSGGVHLLHRLEKPTFLKDMCLCFPTWILYLESERRATWACWPCWRARNCVVYLREGAGDVPALC